MPNEKTLCILVEMLITMNDHYEHFVVGGQQIFIRLFLNTPIPSDRTILCCYKKQKNKFSNSYVYSIMRHKSLG